MTRTGPNPPAVGDHAIVVGASVAGLATAAALACRFRRVTLVERDPSPLLGEGRRGVPQGAHAHLLLPAGLRALEELLPGVASDVVRAGGSIIPAPEFRFFLGAGRLAISDDSMAIAGATRPLIEGVVRRRVAGLDNASFLDGHAVEEPVTDGGARVTGVRLRDLASSSARTLEADLVVDATGRRSRTPGWLEQHGFPTPKDERMEVGVHYTTRLFHRDATDLGGCRHVAIAPPPGTRRGGLVLAVEGDRWLVTLVGTVGERPPTGLDDFIDYATSLWQPDIHRLIRRANPLGDAVTGGFPAHRRRRYDALRRFPEGLVVTGDAVCSLSPTYAQGMTVAVCEAQILGQVLDRRGLGRIGHRFFRRTRPLVDTAWRLATGADLADPGIEGRRTLAWRALSRYLERALDAATADPVVADALLAVNALVAPPPSILRPRIASRVLRHGVRSATAEGPPSRAPPALDRRTRPTEDRKVIRRTAPAGVSRPWRSASTVDSAAPTGPATAPSSSAARSARRSAKRATSCTPSGPATSAGWEPCGSSMRTSPWPNVVPAASTDPRHRRQEGLGPDRPDRQARGPGGAVEEHEHRPGGRLSRQAHGHAHPGCDLVPAVGGVEATVEVGPLGGAHRGGDGRGAGEGSCTSMPRATPAASWPGATRSAISAFTGRMGKPRRSANTMIPKPPSGPQAKLSLA